MSQCPTVSQLTHLWHNSHNVFEVESKNYINGHGPQKADAPRGHERIYLEMCRRKVTDEGNNRKKGVAGQMEAKREIDRPDRALMMQASHFAAG